MIAPKSFEVLLCLVRRAGQVVLKSELLKEIWPDSFVEESNLTQHIFWIRKALGDRSEYIVTIPGRGYEFTGPVEIVTEGTAAAEEGLASAEAGLAAAPVAVVRAEEPDPETEETATYNPAPKRRAGAGEAGAGSVGRRPAALAAAALLLAGSSVWGARLWRERTVRGDHHEVVLASFENMTGDPAFAPALKTLLAIDLAQSPYLVVAGDSDTQKVLKLMNREPDDLAKLPVALEACQRLNDQVVLTGLIANFGRKYLITLTASGCEDGKTLVQSKATADGRDDVLRAVDSTAAEIRRKLGESLSSRSNAGQPLPMVHTFSLDALRAYSQGLAFSGVSRHREAIPLYQRAVELDPRFAAAYFSLADSYRAVGEEAQWRLFLSKAYELRDQGDEFLRFRIVSDYNSAVTGDLRARLANFISWSHTYPNQMQPWQEYASMESAVGHPELAIEPIRRAIALAPNEGRNYSILCGVYLDLAEPEEARKVCREAIARKVDSWVIHFELYRLAVVQHDDAGAAEQLAWTKGTEFEDQFTMYPLFAAGKAHAAVAVWMGQVNRHRKAGFSEKADAQLRILLRREAEYHMDKELREQLRGIDWHVNPQNLVFAYAELGHIAEAEACLKLLDEATGMSTVYKEVYIPEAHAVVALARHKPQEAIEDLEIERAYSRIDIEQAIVRADAYLAAGELKLAEAEYRRNADRVYQTADKPSGPMSHLGLARVYKLEGNVAASRREYETLFEIWKDADADLPLLVQARREYAGLR